MVFAYGLIRRILGSDCEMHRPDVSHTFVVVPVIMNCCRAVAELFHHGLENYVLA